ncbi:MAG: hypothetical protein M3N52_04165 [Actinomycetota bacterium]|nr:hypothetical protein [Actinomycetota bacterium]
MSAAPHTRRGADPAPGPASPRDRRDGWALIAVAAWTAYVWINRAVLLLRDPDGDPALVVHSVLTVVSLATAVVVGAIGLRLLRRSR